MATQRVGETLPAYLMPAIFVAPKGLPTTPNGKIDRLALPEPDPARPKLDVPFVAPRTSVEEELAEIWAQILKLDAVGMYDLFLELGGNSLLAMQVLARLHSALAMEIPVTTLFAASTIDTLALAITQQQAHLLTDQQLDRLLRELDGN
ncbi:MAG: hypothetical protein HC802_14315 [Caldilineaceae bacterium]|nr:hypothetical protein [Caldilineaceae bacterium]